MTVGNQLTVGNVNASISQLAVEMRNLMLTVQNLSKNVNGQGNGSAVLVAAGFTAADATAAIAAIAYLNTMAGVYFGTVQQGGTGGTGAATFNFDNQLSQFWGGQ